MKVDKSGLLCYYNITGESMEVKITTCKCLRCGYSWTARKPIVVVCAHCHSPYWALPRRGDKIEQSGIRREVERCPLAEETVKNSGT